MSATPYRIGPALVEPALDQISGERCGGIDDGGSDLERARADPAFVGDPPPEQALVDASLAGDFGDRAPGIDHPMSGLDLYSVVNDRRVRDMVTSFQRDQPSRYLDVHQSGGALMPRGKRIT